MPNNKFVGVSCDRSKAEGVPYMFRKECDECVQQPNHPCPFHGKQLLHMWGDTDNEPSGDAYSPTRILGCERKKFFAAHAETHEQILDPYYAYPMQRGHFVHGYYEKLPMAPGTIKEYTEIRFQHTVNTKYGPKLFQGKPDLIEVLSDKNDIMHVKLVDWKSTKTIGHDFLSVKEDHGHQVNMYAWLLFHELPVYLGRPNLVVVVDELAVIYVDMGKTRRFTSKCALTDRGKILTPRREKNYEPIQLAQMHLGSMEKLGEWIKAHIESTIDAQTVMAPPLEGDDAKICDYCSFKVICAELAQKERQNATS